MALDFKTQNNRINRSAESIHRPARSALAKVELHRRALERWREIHTCQER
jgi:hypothetical protein